MSITVELLAEEERPLVVKRADGADADSLRAEADRLRQASHPGVVQVLSSAPSADGWELRTVHAGRPIEVGGPMEVRQIAAVAAGLAATLADLHASGIVHGRVDASHVLVGAHGRPVLCGFGTGQAEPPPAPADDVAAIGELLVALLGPEGEAEPIPERRWSPRRRWTGWERRALLTLADQACAEPATRRPTARRLAAAISEAVPTASITATADDHPRSGEADEDVDATASDPYDALRATAAIAEVRPSPRAIPVMLAALGVAALVVAVNRPATEAADPVAPAASSSSMSTSTASPTPTTSAESLAPTSTTVEPCGPIGGVDLDGDGCGEPVGFDDGQMVTIGDDRFQVGERGDEVVIRDWDCDGQPTPALLRPRTGEVFVFPRWDPDADVVVPPIATVAGGTELVVAPASSACSGLGVRTPDAVIPVLRGPA